MMKKVHTLLDGPWAQGRITAPHGHLALGPCALGPLANGHGALGPGAMGWARGHKAHGPWDPKTSIFLWTNQGLTRRQRRRDGVGGRQSARREALYEKPHFDNKQHSSNTGAEQPATCTGTSR